MTDKETIAELKVQLERANARYRWCANELLACDYGDNPRADDMVIGWRVYGWRSRDGERRIYGDSIDQAVDAELP